MLQKHLETKTGSPNMHKFFLVILSLLNAEAAINLIKLSDDSFVSKITPKTFNFVALSITISSNKKLGKMGASYLDLEITRILFLQDLQAFLNACTSHQYEITIIDNSSAPCY